MTNNDIDLSKIKVKETPTQKIKANFDGTEKEYEIRALTDGERANFQSILTSGKDVYRTRNLYVFLLSCGLGLEQIVCDLLFDNCTQEAVRVADLIFQFSRDFEEKKAAEAKEAEKNSATVA